MRQIKFKSALTVDGWLDNPVIEIDEAGVVASVKSEVVEPAKIDASLPYVALPGIPNVHSHAFQRGFAGMSEFRTALSDSFWTWRNLMYSFVSILDPDDVYIIARQLYFEMLLAGYTCVGEFHYLHQSKEGTPYEKPTEMADAIIRAAEDSGIRLVLLPVVYQRGGFKNQVLSAEQCRFRLTNEQYLELFDALKCRTNQQFSLGCALHSLRAVSNENAEEILGQVGMDLPIHIHISEQRKEVESCLKHHGLKPIEYLINHFDVSGNWTLIHATHADQLELKRMIENEVTVGLCPTTEANLGDGIFPAAEFDVGGGDFCFGSDSHVSVDFREEMRMLEYGQRLLHRRRAVMATESTSVGRHLFSNATKSGAKSLQINAGQIEVGRLADFVLIDDRHVSIAGAAGDQILDRLIFCNNDSPVVGSCVGGSCCTLADANFQQRFMNSQAEFLAIMSKFSRCL